MVILVCISSLQPLLRIGVVFVYGGYAFDGEKSFYPDTLSVFDIDTKS